MIDANINIVTGETIYLSHGSFSDHTIHPYVALVEFNMKDALIEMVKESTVESRGYYTILDKASGPITLNIDTALDIIVEDFISKEHDFQYDFIAHLIQKGYIISPKQRIIELGGDNGFEIKENNIDPGQEKEDARAMEEYEKMMGYL